MEKDFVERLKLYFNDLMHDLKSVSRHLLDAKKNLKCTQKQLFILSNKHYHLISLWPL